MSATTYGLALLAGTLSTLSPCVLPLLPAIVGGAVSRHALGPMALATGLATAYTASGVFAALIGAGLEFSASWIRGGAAVLMILAGYVLLVPSAGERLAIATRALAVPAGRLMSRLSAHGPVGQFAIGLLLGTVWLPCVGPTLGATLVLAAQGQNLGQVVLTMFLFGVGAAWPLLAIGVVSRRLLGSSTAATLRAGSLAKAVFGWGLVVAGSLVVTGLDKDLERLLVARSPDWLTSLTIAF